jgi:hypothetical protein
MALGSEKNYINAADKLRVGWASTGVDQRRGLPNNRLQNSADIPDFHPRFHLNNDAGKLSRHMVATRKYKETMPAWASHPPRSPLLCLVGSAIAASPTPSHGSAIAASPNIPAVCHHSFPAQPVGTPRLDSNTYYARPYPCRLMVVLFSWVVAPWTGPLIWVW